MAKKEPFYKGVNQKQFVNKDGYLKGGVEVKIPEEIPTVNKVGGQRRNVKGKKNLQLSGAKIARDACKSYFLKEILCGLT